jgi:hypothetical protein
MSMSYPMDEHPNPYAPSQLEEPGHAAVPTRTNYWPSKRELLRTVWIIRAAALFWGLWSLRQLVGILTKVFVPHPPISLPEQIAFLAHPEVLVWFIGNLMWLGLNFTTAWLDWQTAEQIRRFAGGADKNPIGACRLFRRAWIFNLAAFSVYLALEAFDFVWRAFISWQ